MPPEMRVPSSDDSLLLRSLEILRRRRLLAAAVFAAVMAASASFALYLPDLYRATAVVLVERPVSDAIVRTPAAGELESRLHIIKQEILSRDRLTDLIERFDLYPDLRRRASLEDVLAQARNDIVVEPIGAEQVTGRVKTVAFRLSYRGDARETVADVTNAVAAFYVEQNDAMRSQEAIRTTQILAQQLAEAKAELERQERALRDFTASNASELPQQTMIALARLERLNDQLGMNQSRQLRLMELRDRQFEGIRDTSAAARIAPDASPQAIELVKQVEEVKLKLTEAEARFASQHPDVRALREQLNALEAQLAIVQKADAERRAAQEAARAAAQAAAAPVQGRRTLEDIDAELAALKREEADLKQQVLEIQHRLESTPFAQQEYTRVTRDYSTAKEIYDSLLRRYQDAQLTQSVETSRAGEHFRILEPAIPPEGPAAPNRVRLLILGLLLATVVSGAAVVLREQFDVSFHTVDDVRDFTSVPVLVSIPPIGPAPAFGRIKAAFAAASAVAAIALIATAAAYLARDNNQLVRLIAF